MNKCIFIGRLGQDLDVRSTKSGKTVATGTLACNEPGSKGGSPTWVKLIFWDKLADIASNYLAKGSQICVECKFANREWQDKDGNKRFSPEFTVKELEMLGGDREHKSFQRTNDRSVDREPTGGQNYYSTGNDEIPF